MRPANCTFSIRTFLDGRKLKVGQVLAQLGVVGCLFELPVGLACVKDDLALEIGRLCHHVDNVLDGDLILLSH